MSFAAVLLCGGRSTRMGRDKAFLDWDGRPLWQVQLEKLQQLAPQRLLISCREEQKVEQVFNLFSKALNSFTTLQTPTTALSAQSRDVWNW